jgi:tRNA G10  N-methylase Trm11
MGTRAGAKTNRGWEMKHPAKYSMPLLGIFKDIVYENYPLQNKQQKVKILDPFAGTGRIHDIDLNFETVGIEIEKEWADMHEKTICADSTNMPFNDDFFDFIITSPTYGNRMADCHNAKDGTKRNTYTHVLGRMLSDNNSGKMQFGNSYKKLHEKVYQECKRVLYDGGYLVLNMKNHIRKGIEVDVCGWHKQCLLDIGFDFKYEITVKLKGNGFGKNMDKKVPYEKVMIFTASKNRILI